MNKKAYKLKYGRLIGIIVFLMISYCVKINLDYSDIVKNFEASYDLQKMSERDKIDSIREYVYTNSVFANGEELLLDGFSHEIFGLTKKERVVKYFQLQRNYKGGLYCDGFADMLAMFYQLMGYDSYRLNLNVDGNTHCVTLVKCEGEWIIEDPTFNYSFFMEEETGLQDMIHNLRYELGEQVEIIEGNEKKSLAISYSTSESWTSMYPILLYKGTQNGRNIYVIDRSCSNYSMYELMYPYFLQDGYLEHFKFSLLYAEGIVWKYGIEDVIFGKKHIEEDLEEIECQIGI